MFFSRGPNKVKNPYVLKDMYREYIKDKEKGSPYDISYNTFVDICEQFYKGVAEHVLNGGIYMLPYRMGNISIVRVTPKKLDKRTLPIDWQKTVELGKQVFQLNDHSNYDKFRFHWSKKNCNVKNKSGYRLVFTRDNKRELARIIKSGEYEYFSLK